MGNPPHGAGFGTRKTLIGSAGLALVILAFINLFNYLDRYVVSALVESLRHSELKLTDTQSGSLMSGFLIVFAAVAPIFGVLGDRRSRPRLIAFGVACWSVATALSGLAWNFTSLFVARATVGVGEAAYVTVGPSLLSDYYPRHQRGRVMAIFFCAIPVGSALGYVVGGLMGVHFGWRAAFFVAGAPGLLLAFLCLGLPDPPRGSQDGEGTDADEGASAGERADAGERASAGASADARGHSARTFLELLHNKAYVLTIAGYAAYTFAMGGLAYWMPAFLERMRGVPPDQATVSFGIIVVITGFVGTFAGGWLGDFCARYTQRAYLWISAVATLIAVPFAWIALTSASSTLYLVCMVIAQLLMFLSTGPINASIVNLVLPTQRASANALGVFAIHFLGDVPSPLLIGAVSDHSSLLEAVKLVPVAILAAAGIWVFAALAHPARPLIRTEERS
jgi:MFS transporter, Spinster family, sphingosine-1-phosphate transporter